MISVLVLMSTYNGERFITEQIYSLLNQVNVSLSILIRDDGSTDSTIEIIKAFQKKYKNIKYYSGKNKGFAKSFWDLVLRADDNYDYYAFCDQDDIWCSKKMFQAINMIKCEKNDIPILYTSNVTYINSNGQKIEHPKFQNGVLNVYQSFQKSILPGCTFVFNRSAHTLIKRYNGRMYAHDWATYTIISSFGKVIYDPNEYIYYRIHDNNTIGINSKFDDFKKKLSRFFNKSDCIRMKFARDFYDVYRDELKDSEWSKDIFYLGHYQEKLNYKFRLFISKNFKGIIFKIFVILNRI